MLGWSAKGSDCGTNLVVRAFSIAFKHSCGAHTVRWTVALPLAAGVPKATILTYFYPEVTVEKMSAYRKKQ